METTDYVCGIPILINRYFDYLSNGPSRSDEIEKLKLPGDLDPVTFDLDLDPPISVLMSQGSLMPSFISFHPTVWLPFKDKHTNKHILSF